MDDIFLGNPPDYVSDWILRQQPFCIEALEDGTVSFQEPATTVQISLVYSVDGKSWNEFSNSTGVSLTSGETLYLKAKTENPAYGSFSYMSRFSATCRFNVSGNIMSLLYNEFESKNIMSSVNEYCFQTLFLNNPVVDASKLILPATVLAQRCYYSMFENCTSLIAAPKLPATQLADWCYCSMFAGCTSLTAAPELPAMICATGCYASMFKSCSSLVNAPALPALQVADNCYNFMFQSCTSLVNAPVLPATSLAEYCYYGMFCNCTSMAAAPKLPATTFADRCYMVMFSYDVQVKELHFPASVQSDSEFTSLEGSPTFGAPNAAVYFDL